MPRPELNQPKSINLLTAMQSGYFLIGGKELKTINRSIASILAVIMIIGSLSGMGAATNDSSEETIWQDEAIQQDELNTEDVEVETDLPIGAIGTAIDPSTGEEHPVLSSVEDIIPDNLDELVAVGAAAEAELTAQDEPATETAQEESAEETPPAQTETVAPSLEDFAAEYDTSEVSDVDLSSCRILVSADAGDIITEDAVLAKLDGMYLMQFEDEDTAALAYMYYNDKADYADADAPLMIAENEAAPAIEDADMSPLEMNEDANPFTEVQTVIEELQESSPESPADKPVVAVIDTGVSSAIEAVRYSVMGDDGYDNHGHGTRMAEIITDICPNAQIVSIKAVDDSGVGSTSSLYAAVQLAIELQVDIINLSVYGLRTTENSSLETVIQTAIDAGIEVVGAAGNSGRDAANYIPGCIREAVIAGAANSDGSIANFSNRGDTVDYYLVSSSTSTAAAGVSGILASGRTVEEYLNYTDPADPAAESHTEIDAATFVRHALLPYNAGDDYGTVEDMIPDIYREITEDNYLQILFAAYAWGSLTSGDQSAVNSAIQTAYDDDDASFESIATDACVYLYENHDGGITMTEYSYDLSAEDTSEEKQRNIVMLYEIPFDAVNVDDRAWTQTLSGWRSITAARPTTAGIPSTSDR